MKENAQTIAENVPKVYEAGQKAERDAFWDAITANGTRENYDNAFAQTLFTKETMKPTRDIKPTSANNMFYLCKNNHTNSFSMTEVEQECGIVFDFSNCKIFDQAFNASCFNEINVLDVSKATRTYQMIYNGASSSKLYRINRMIFSENTVIQWGVFGYCTELTYVGFEGAIRANINISACTKMEKQCLLALFNCLLDYG